MPSNLCSLYHAFDMISKCLVQAHQMSSCPRKDRLECLHSKEMQLQLETTNKGPDLLDHLECNWVIVECNSTIAQLAKLSVSDAGLLPAELSRCRPCPCPSIKQPRLTLSLTLRSSWPERQSVIRELLKSSVLQPPALLLLQLTQQLP